MSTYVLCDCTDKANTLIIFMKYFRYLQKCEIDVSSSLMSFKSTT